MNKKLFGMICLGLALSLYASQSDDSNENKIDLPKDILAFNNQPNQNIGPVSNMGNEGYDPTRDPRNFAPSREYEPQSYDPRYYDNRQYYDARDYNSYNNRNEYYNNQNDYQRDNYNNANSQNQASRYGNQYEDYYENRPRYYDPYDPRNYESYRYDPYDPRNYERYYAPQVQVIPRQEVLRGELPPRSMPVPPRVIQPREYNPNDYQNYNPNQGWYDDAPLNASNTLPPGGKMPVPALPNEVPNNASMPNPQNINPQNPNMQNPQNANQNRDFNTNRNPTDRNFNRNFNADTNQNVAPSPRQEPAINYAPQIPAMPNNGVDNMSHSITYLTSNNTKPSILLASGTTEDALQNPLSASGALNAAIEQARKGDYKKALELFNTSCAQGNPAACFGLGTMFMYGAGVQSDTTKAMKYYQMGCAGGDPAACSNLGILYDEQTNNPESKSKAAEMYMAGCQGGDISACNNLGWAYANGQGVPKDYYKSIQYYRFACDGGSELGCYNLGLMTNTSSIYGQDKSQLSVPDLNYRACNAGDVIGCANLGWIYSQGLEGKNRNYTLAAQYFNTACIGGVMSSCNNLGVLYENGKGVTQSKAQAMQMYSLACQGGLESGCQNFQKLNSKK